MIVQLDDIKACVDNEMAWDILKSHQRGQNKHIYKSYYCINLYYDCNIQNIFNEEDIKKLILENIKIDTSRWYCISIAINFIEILCYTD
jgi:hypothetical protein